MNTLHFIIASLVVLFIACEGPAGPSGPQGEKGTNGTNAVSDKQIRLVFPNVAHSTIDTGNGMVLPSLTHIFKFNKAYYPNVDSVIFVGLIRTTDTSASCIAEIFNVTDTVAIANSAIQSDSTTLVSVESKNCFANLPAKEVTLAVRIRSAVQGTSVSVARAELYLYRK